ncbi:MAG: hypothetical protein DIZ80_06460 [endosymbiont of Galathealinum brachiosum]|uniref:NodB homology domain-containing protein n=1 Tax=endosymbiont of Galathealinum brachiosum TaxID=2200906 RepID=A0A370DHZ2_9GAMM|nr:MAG: hypothetical protein DIZ80_06460 [endosymbiont of Galathealinum brachiosum]
MGKKCTNDYFNNLRSVMKSLIKNIIYFFTPNFYNKFHSSSKDIYITFDDGPSSDNTCVILDVFKKHKMTATFFLIGSEMEKHPDIVKRIINEDHAIGYHSFSHKSLKSISFFEFIEDLKSAKLLFNKYSIKNKFYRPPYGDLTVFKFLWMIVTGWKIIMWSHDSRDSFDDKNIVLESILHEEIQFGSIHLFHDDYDDTAEIMPKILEHYSNNGVNCAKIHI